MTQSAVSKNTMTDTHTALFYQNPVALDKKLHGHMSVSPRISLDFTKHINAVPITLVELPHVMQFYPIAFSMNAPASPLAILGLRNQENLFVDENGEWLADTYIPAYIRRYPFIFAKDPDAPDRLTLCIDDTAGILYENNNNRLFDENGEITPTTQNALDFCRSYQASAESTLEFSKALEESNILIDRHAEVRFSENQIITLSGFRQIDEEKFNALPKDIIGLWHEKNWLNKTYASIFSDRNWQTLFQLTEQRLKHEAEIQSHKQD